MKIEFDPVADALYLQFQPGKAKESIKVQEGIIIDISEDGKLFGIEIIGASQRIPLAQLGRIDSNLPLKKAS